MNNTNTIRNLRPVGGNYFQLIKDKKCNSHLIDFINLFNFDDYWCYKTTRNQRLVTQEEFLEFKNGGYTFFKKDLYDINKIEEWIEWMIGMGGIQFLIKPVPPFSPNKVIIRELI